MARFAVGLVLIAVFVVGMYFATAREAAVTCEVCLQFGAERNCKSASGIDRERALYAAQSVACATMSGGVTEGMQCQRARPASVSCSE